MCYKDNYIPKEKNRGLRINGVNYSVRWITKSENIKLTLEDVVSRFRNYITQNLAYTKFSLRGCVGNHYTTTPPHKNFLLLPHPQFKNQLFIDPF